MFMMFLVHKPFSGLVFIARAACAGAFGLEFVTMGFDRHHFVGWRKSESLGDAILKKFHVGVFEFDDLFAVHTDQVVVSRVLEEVGIVDLCLAAQIEFAQESAFHQDRKGAIDRSAGNRFVDGSRHHQEFLCRVVFMSAESSLNDGIALRGLAKTFFR